ncbi:MAG: hypothetical protein IJU76_02490 [Desulfovibrionaceae bacterium]|nr:hypothetical protein [Desulfovibrionaceae bacterium]
MTTIFVEDSKGGVGKSMISCLVLHALLDQKPIFIETDDCNPDVFKIYKKKLIDIESKNEGEKIDNPIVYDLDTERGWQGVFKKICYLREKNIERPVIVNTGSRNISAIEKYGILFDGIGDITTLWPIDNGKECLNLLADFLKIYHQKICVIKNGFFANEEDFDDFNKSVFNNADNKIPNVFLDRATLGIINGLNNRIPFDEMGNSLHIVDQILAKAWLEKASNTIKDAINSAKVYVM